MGEGVLVRTHRRLPWLRPRPRSVWVRQTTLIIADDSEWALHLPGLATAKNPAGLVANGWVPLAGVCTGTETRVYVHGVLAGSSTKQPDGQDRSVSDALDTS